MRPSNPGPVGNVAQRHAPVLGQLTNAPGKNALQRARPQRLFHAQIMGRRGLAAVLYRE